MKFYKKWKTEKGIPIEIDEPIKTGKRTKPFRLDEKIYIGIQYTNEGSVWWKRQDAYPSDVILMDTPNVVDTVANFHTDSLEAYLTGDYRIDDNIRKQELNIRSQKHILKMKFLKDCSIEGAKYLYEFYRAIPAVANKNLPPSQKPMVWWSKWNNWKKKNQEQYHLLISKIKSYEQSN